MSVMEAFKRMVAPDAERTDGVTKEQIRAGLVSLGCYLPYHEVSDMLCAFDCTPDGYITAHNWVTVLCATKAAPPKRSVSPQRGSSTGKSRPTKVISLAAESIQTYEPFSAQSSILDPRLSAFPSSQASFITMKGNRRSASSVITEESGYISPASLSNVSSLQPVLETQVLATSQPGTRLIQAARAFTNFSSGPYPQVNTEERLMRCLGSLIYSGPGRHHEVLGQLDAGGVALVLRVNGLWANVRVGKVEGWVSLQHLDPTIDRKIYTEKDKELGEITAVEAKSKATVYMRKAPDWSAKAVKKLAVNEVTEVLGGNKDWVKVMTTSGYKGWVAQPDTSIHGGRPLSQSQGRNTQGGKGELGAETTKAHTKSAVQVWIEAMRPSPLSPHSREVINARIAAKMAVLVTERLRRLQIYTHKSHFRNQLVARWKNIAIARGFM